MPSSQARRHSSQRVQLSTKRLSSICQGNVIRRGVSLCRRKNARFDGFISSLRGIVIGAEVHIVCPVLASKASLLIRLIVATDGGGAEIC